jgi:hypothetical protein
MTADDAPRRDWRDTVRTAADLAVLGFAVTLACLPVLTAGAAVGTASEAVRHFLTYDSWPRAAVVRATFRRRLVPGLWAGPLALAGVALLALDIEGVRHGLVPGGLLVLPAVLVVAVLAVGWAALAAVLAGDGSRGVPRAALTLAAARPPLLLAAAGVVLVAGLLALLVHPALIPILAGFVLFALHAVTARLHPAAMTSSGAPT